MKIMSCFAIALSLCISAPVLSQGYASKPIRLVITFPPGGVDVTVRPLLPSIENDLGQPVILEYRSGAGGDAHTNSHKLKKEEWMNGIKWFKFHDALDEIEYEDIGKLMLLAMKRIRQEKL